MAKQPRLTLTRDGERAFGRLADGIGRALDNVLRKEQIKKKDLADRAGVHQAVVSRVLDGSRNLETRTIAALFGAVGYALDVVPRSMHASPQNQNNHPPRKAGGGITADFLRNASASSITTMTGADSPPKGQIDVKLRQGNG